MRKFTVPTAVLAVCFMVATSHAGITTKINGKAPHDFGLQPWSNQQICLPCHTPHAAIVKDTNGAALTAAPLWNHTLSTATYTLYVDESGNGVTGDVDQNSKLCLSCHDGTVAADSFGGKTGSNFLTGGIVGTDLSDDHPIGEAAIWPQTWDPTGNGGKGAWTGASYMVTPDLRTAAGIMPLRKMADGRLTVGCTSCHEPHNRKSTENLLWVNNSGPAKTVDGRDVSGSALCMNCHKK